MFSSARFLPMLALLAALLLGTTGHAFGQDVLSIADARSEGVGATVTVEGVVTRAFGDFVRLQDASGPTGASALVIRQTEGAFFDDVQDGTIARGTQLRLTGTLSEFNGLLQINEGDLSDFTVQGDGAVPDPQVVTFEDLTAGGEDYESELVSVSSVSLDASGTFDFGTTYTATDPTGTFAFRVQQDSETDLGGEPIPGGAFSYEGVVGQFRDDYQLIPVRTTDLEESLSFRFNRTFANVEEGDEVSVQIRAFNLDGGEASVTVEAAAQSTATNGDDVTGFSGSETFTFSASNAAPRTLTLTTIDEGDETEGVERLELVLSSTDGAVAAPSRFTLWIRDDATAQGTVAFGETGETLIETLQGTYGAAPTLGYDIARDSLYRTIYNDGGTVEAIYTGLEVPVDPNGGDASQQAGDGGVNTEHIWPRSQGAAEEPALSDIHILAPARSPVNTARSNYAFGDIPDADTDTWYFEDQSQSTLPGSNIDAWSELDSSPSDRDARRFEPRESVKGDVARAAFYFVTMYPSRANLQFYETQKDVLFEWHKDDPVDAAEMRRNILTASYQGNKLNPFIVDRTLVDRAYFSGGGSPGGNLLTIAEARDAGGGASVTVEGVVTRLSEDGPYIQDDTAGLYVFESEGAFGEALGTDIRVGTELRVTGSLTFFNGLLELTDVADTQFEVLSQGNALPDPVTVTLGEIAANGEDYEAELIRVDRFAIDDKGDNVFQAGGTGGNYIIDDGTTTLTLRIPGGSALEREPIPEEAAFEGVLGQFNGEGFGADAPDSGYQLTALNIDDLQPAAIEVPDVTQFSITRTFGPVESASSYQLVALPGQIDQPLSETLSGSAGVDWQAFRDDGSDTDFLVPYAGDDADFTFAPGNGFWVLGTTDWTVEDSVPTVPISDDGAASINLRDGWNVISNPLPIDVSWDRVLAFNSLSPQPLWQWGDTGFAQASTFTSATTGEAFYFLNSAGRQSLQIPIGAGGSSTPTATDTRNTVALSALHNDAVVSRVRMGERSAPHRVAAPPQRFAPTTMHLQASSGATARQSALAEEYRTAPDADAGGQQYTLRLRADDTRSVTLHADALPTAAGVQAVLVDPATQMTYDLRETPSVPLTATPDGTTLHVLVGSARFVERNAPSGAVAEQRVRPPAPNPFRDNTTLAYTLSEAQHVRVTVFDMLGRRIRTLVDERQESGAHRVKWQAADPSLGSGMYFLRWEAGGDQQTYKVVRIR